MLLLKDAIAANAGKGTKMFRFYKTTHRVADRFSPRVANSWLKAVTMFQAGISETAVGKAIASGNLARIEKAIGGSRFGRMMLALEDPLARTAAAAGKASAKTLGVGGFEFEFNATHTNVIQFARDQAAALVVDVADDAREAIRTVTALGAQQGLTIPQQARAIREIVPLPPPWQAAPLHLAEDIRKGRTAAATARRLSATDKAQIRSRIAKGTVTDDFVKQMQTRYTNSLVNRRGLNIAATESLRAANFGVQNSWEQAVQQGALSNKSRKFWLVTPDERLSQKHATIPGLNLKGRKINEMFVTTEGPHMHPPSRPNCRCSVGLGAVAGTGVVTGPAGAGKASGGVGRAVTTLPPRKVAPAGGGAAEVGGGAGVVPGVAERAAIEAAERAAKIAAEKKAADKALKKARKAKVAREAAAKEANEKAAREAVEKATQDPVIPTPQKLLDGSPLRVSQSIADKPVEWGSGWDSTGNIVFRETSNHAYKLQIKQETLHKLKDGVFIHNHPTGSSFSTVDLDVAVRNNIKEMWAVHTEQSFRVVRPPNGWPSLTEVQGHFQDAHRAWLQRLEKLREGGLKRASEEFRQLDLNMMHSIWEEAFAKMGAHYERFNL